MIMLITISIPDNARQWNEKLSLLWLWTECRTNCECLIAIDLNHINYWCFSLGVPPFFMPQETGFWRWHWSCECDGRSGAVYAHYSTGLSLGGCLRAWPPCFFCNLTFVFVLTSFHLHLKCRKREWIWVKMQRTERLRENREGRNSINRGGGGEGIVRRPALVGCPVHEGWKKIKTPNTCTHCVWGCVINNVRAVPQ